MRKVWNYVNTLKISNKSKNHLFLLSMILICAFLGALVWIIGEKFLLLEITWLLCFIGYPAVFIGFFGGVVYLFNHEFL